MYQGALSECRGKLFFVAFFFFGVQTCGIPFQLATACSLPHAAADEWRDSLSVGSWQKISARTKKKKKEKICIAPVFGHKTSETSMFLCSVAADSRGHQPSPARFSVEKDTSLIQPLKSVRRADVVAVNEHHCVFTIKL